MPASVVSTISALGSFSASQGVGTLSPQPTAGNTLVAAFVWQWDTNASDTVTAVRDSAGNTYTRIGTQIEENAGSGFRIVMYYAKNINTATGFGVIGDFTNAVGAPSIAVAELAGVDTVSPLGIYGGRAQVGVSQGTDVVSTSATNIGTPAEDGHVIIAHTGFTAGSDALSAGTGGYTDGASALNPFSHRMIYLVQTTASPVNASWSYTGLGVTAVSYAATFKAAGGGGSSPFKPSKMFPDGITPMIMKPGGQNLYQFTSQ